MRFMTEKHPATGTLDSMTEWAGQPTWYDASIVGGNAAGQDVHAATAAASSCSLRCTLTGAVCALLRAGTCAHGRRWGRGGQGEGVVSHAAEALSCLQSAAWCGCAAPGLLHRAPELGLKLGGQHQVRFI